MRAEAAALRDTCHAQLETLSDLFVRLDDPGPACPQCAHPLHVQKTRPRRGVTLAHGRFHLRDTVYVCTTPGCAGAGKAQASALAAMLPPGSVVGYDVLTEVGVQRFVHHRQREEIQAALARDGVVLSTGEISRLARRFLVYLQALHEASAPALAAALAADGGWPLHLDATGEDGRGTLLVAYAGWRRWVLGAWKIPTERAEAIGPAIASVAQAFGPPAAIMRDLGHAMAEASEAFVAFLPGRIPILACHFHFLADIGGDLLTKGHDQLRQLFRQVGLLGRLRAFVRARGLRLGSAITRERAAVRDWLATPSSGKRLPDGLTGLAVVRSLAQWILDYAAEGTDAGFPFDVPYLALYDRCLQVSAAVRAFLRDAPATPRVTQSLRRLQAMLQPVSCDVPPLASTAAALTERVSLFTALRAALRLTPARADAVGRPDTTAAALQDIQHAVTTLAASLRARRPARGPGKHLRQAIDCILAHLERHGPHLWGHALTMPGPEGPRTRCVDRTNDILEAFFHRIKHGERRRSGRKILTQDFEGLPAAAALAVNLTRADYVQIVCGSLQRLPAAFAKLDADARPRSVASRVAGAPIQLETASLSTADRRLMRTEALGDRIVAAAQAR